MKSIKLLIIFFIYSINVYAYPELHDYARFEAPYNGSMVIYEKTIKDVDPEKQSYLVNTLITYKGQIIQEKEAVLPRAFLFTQEKIQNVLKTCASRGGARWHTEIQGQTIQTCSYYNEDSMLEEIVGDVPFGQIRFQIYLEGEEFLDFNLVKFKTVLSE